MTLKGETVGNYRMKCECGEYLELEVLHTCAYYVGFFCPNCGPYSRESEYYKTAEEAQAAIDNGQFER